MEGLSQYSSSGLAEQDPARVDTDNLVRARHLLNAIAVVIDLGECCAEVVRIVRGCDGSGHQMISGKRIIALASLISFSCSRTIVVDWAAILICSVISCAVQVMDLEQTDITKEQQSTNFTISWISCVHQSSTSSGWWCETHTLSLSPDPNVGIEEVHCCVSLVIQHLGRGGSGGGGTKKGSCDWNTV